ncbi:hypothetical protein DY000_02019453 [Brassica cretica]|uniref:ATP-dependent RNA helicase n=1 Tax=Brassica cretica TaxID=69181 RepID=A0ABQ7CW75_BRACR|nr:hypothetical protein DY000_02019453 [Brassica cretica]
MTSDGPKSGKKRREIRAKLAKELAGGEDESGNKRGPKRGREDKSADVDEPLIKKAASTVSVEAADNKPKTSDSYLSKTRFDQFPLSPLSLKGIQDAGFKTMTVVQEATLPIILKGKRRSFFLPSPPPAPLVPMTSDGPKSGKKRREIRAKLAKELAGGEDESGNKRGPKREREDKSADVDEPLIKKAASTVSVEAADNKPKTSDSYLSKTRFDQFPLSPLSLKGIQDAGFKTMTVVQEATLPIILKGLLTLKLCLLFIISSNVSSRTSGKDVLAKAKTGTGKTVAFLVRLLIYGYNLLPSIEAVIKSPPVSRDNRHPPIIVLVVCPTRELACQAAAEANILLKYHSSIGVEVVIGGTKLPAEQRRMQKHPCQALRLKMLPVELHNFSF